VGSRRRRERVALGVLQQFSEDEGEAGGGAGGGEFGEGAGGESGEMRGGGDRSGRGFVLMRFREPLPQLTAQVMEIRGHLGFRTGLCSCEQYSK
jgi:hypothetical protein